MKTAMPKSCGNSNFHMQTKKPFIVRENEILKKAGDFQIRCAECKSSVGAKNES